MFSVAACGSNTSVKNGIYYMVCENEFGMVPNIRLSLEDSSCSLSGGLAMSYSEHGNFEIHEGKLIVYSQTTTYVFEILDDDTLVLIDNGNGGIILSDNSKFIYSKDLK